jgi:polyhydroxyalkanoate synthesis regulator phasin
MLLGLLKSLSKSLKTVDRASLIKSLIENGKISKDEKKKLVSQVIVESSDLKADEVTSTVFVNSKDNTKKKILAAILDVAIAGGLGYLKGGQAGAGAAAAKQLLEELDGR